MARTNLTANKRAFRRNPKNFLDKITELPINVRVNDGVNPEYEIRVDAITSRILNEDKLRTSGITTDLDRPGFYRQPEF